MFLLLKLHKGRKLCDHDPRPSSYHLVQSIFPAPPDVDRHKSGLKIHAQQVDGGWDDQCSLQHILKMVPGRVHFGHSTLTGQEILMVPPQMETLILCVSRIFCVTLTCLIPSPILRNILYLGSVSDNSRAGRLRQTELHQGEYWIPLLVPSQPANEKEQTCPPGLHFGRSESAADRCRAEIAGKQAEQLTLLPLLRDLLVYAGLPEDSRLLPVGGDEPGEEEEDPRY